MARLRMRCYHRNSLQNCRTSSNFKRFFYEYVLFLLLTLTPLTSSKIRPSSVKSTINSCISISISPLPADAPSSYAAMRGDGVTAARVPKQPAGTMVLLIGLEVELHVGPTRDDTSDEEGAWIVATNASTAYVASTARQRTRTSGEEIMLNRNNTRRCFARWMFSRVRQLSCLSDYRNERAYIDVKGLSRPGLLDIRISPRRSKSCPLQRQAYSRTWSPRECRKLCQATRKGDNEVVPGARLKG